MAILRCCTQRSSAEPRFSKRTDLGSGGTITRECTSPVKTSPARVRQPGEQQASARDDIFRDRPAMRYSELILAIREGLKVSEATAERRVATWRKLGLVKKEAAGLWG